jgi:hypothetical protein
MNKYSHRKKTFRSASSSKLFTGLNSNIYVGISPERLKIDQEVSLANATGDNLDLGNAVKPALPIFRSASMDLKSVLPPERLDKNVSISKFTMIQNKIISTSLQKVDKEKKPVVALPQIEFRKLLHSEHDFFNILSKLSSVTTPRKNNRVVLYSDLEPIDIILDENQIEYCKVIVKDFKTPLSVKIRRMKGKVITYMSTQNNEPGPSNYDRYFVADYFEIKETTEYFKYDTIFFGIKALEDCFIRVSVTFGKPQSLLEIKKLKRQLSKPMLPQKEPQESLETLKNFQKGSKDFIKINKTVKIITTSSESPDSKIKNWESKRQKVLEKKKNIQEIKKIKNENFLNKRLIKIYLQKIENEKIEQNILQREFESVLITLVYFFRYFESLRSKLFEIKKHKLRRLFCNLTALKIQKNFKLNKNQIPIKDRIFARGRNLLLFYGHNCMNVLKKQSENQTTKFISDFSNAQILSYKFKRFLVLIIYIQKGFRKYKLVKENRIRILNELFDSECRMQIFKKGSIKKNRKKLSVKVVVISNANRMNIIQNYYHECVVRYTEIIRKRIKSIKTLGNSKKLEFGAAPPFDFIPDRKKIENLIEKATSRPSES